MISIVLAYSLFAAGIIGVAGFALGVMGAMANYISLLINATKVKTEDQFNQLLAGTALSALGAIVMGNLGSSFYGYLKQIGPLNEVLPYTIFNILTIFSFKMLSL